MGEYDHDKKNLTEASNNAAPVPKTDVEEDVKQKDIHARWSGHKDFNAQFDVDQKRYYDNKKRREAERPTKEAQSHGMSDAAGAPEGLQAAQPQSLKPGAADKLPPTGELEPTASMPSSNDGRAPVGKQPVMFSGLPPSGQSDLPQPGQAVPAVSDANAPNRAPDVPEQEALPDAAAALHQTKRSPAQKKPKNTTTRCEENWEASVSIPLADDNSDELVSKDGKGDISDVVFQQGTSRLKQYIPKLIEFESQSKERYPSLPYSFAVEIVKNGDYALIALLIAVANWKIIDAPQNWDDPVCEKNHAIMQGQGKRLMEKNIGGISIAHFDGSRLEDIYIHFGVPKTYTRLSIDRLYFRDFDDNMQSKVQKIEKKYIIEDKEKIDWVNLLDWENSTQDGLIKKRWKPKLRAIRDKNKAIRNQVKKAYFAEKNLPDGSKLADGEVDEITRRYNMQEIKPRKFDAIQTDSKSQWSNYFDTIIGVNANYTSAQTMNTPTQKSEGDHIQVNPTQIANLAYMVQLWIVNYWDKSIKKYSEGKCKGNVQDVVLNSRIRNSLPGISNKQGSSG